MTPFSRQSTVTRRRLPVLHTRERRNIEKTYARKCLKHFLTGKCLVSLFSLFTDGIHSNFNHAWERAREVLKFSQNSLQHIFSLSQQHILYSSVEIDAITCCLLFLCFVATIFTNEQARRWNFSSSPSPKSSADTLIKFRSKLTLHRFHQDSVWRTELKKFKNRSMSGACCVMLCNADRVCGQENRQVHERVKVHAKFVVLVTTRKKNIFHSLKKFSRKKKFIAIFHSLLYPLFMGGG